MPVLAVCRGSQVLNVARGGDLVQHLPEVVGDEKHKHTPGVFADHEVDVKDGSRLGTLLGERAPVKSHHHQGFGTSAKGWSSRRGPTTARSRRSRTRRSGSPSACSGTPRRARTQRSSGRSSRRLAPTAPRGLGRRARTSSAARAAASRELALTATVRRYGWRTAATGCGCG